MDNFCYKLFGTYYSNHIGYSSNSGDSAILMQLKHNPLRECYTRNHNVLSPSYKMYNIAIFFLIEPICVVKFNIRVYWPAIIKLKGKNIICYLLTVFLRYFNF